MKNKKQPNNSGAASDAKLPTDDTQVLMRRSMGLSDYPPDAKPTKAEPLKGVYFHYIENGKLEWQGVIYRHVGTEYVLAMTFEWMLGCPSCGYLLKITDLVWNRETRSGYYLYDTHSLFTHSYEEGMAHAAEERNKKYYEKT